MTLRQLMVKFRILKSLNCRPALAESDKNINYPMSFN